ncbi:MAG: T9SS type A sorting domain-containing protein [Chitinophagaceae bacterium]
MKTTITAFLSSLLLLATSFTATAQNCTVNAGINNSFCPGQPISLFGNVGGLYNNASITWSQVSGPAVTITNPASLTTTVSGTVAGGNYVFRLTSQCQDGNIVFDEVAYTVAALTPQPPPADAGFDINTGCLQWGQGIALNATPAPPGFTGSWSVVGGGTGTFTDVSSPTATFTPSQQLTGNLYWDCVPNFNSYILRWTLVSIVPPSPNCPNTQVFSTDDMIINASMWNPVDAAYEYGCGTGNTNLYGTCTGNGTPTWSLLSGPAGYSFPDVNTQNVSIPDLPQGNYVFRYSVSGACVSGTKNVAFVKVSGLNIPITDANANAGAIQTAFCGSIPSTLLLSANAPNVGETGTWTQTGGPNPVTFNDIHDPATLVTGMTNGGSTYTFVWSISNAEGCISSSAVIVRSVTIPSITPVVLSQTCEVQTQLPGGPFGTCVTSNTYSFVGSLYNPMSGAEGWYLSDYDLLSKPGTSSATPGKTTASNILFNLFGEGQHYSEVVDCTNLGLAFSFTGTSGFSNLSVYGLDGITAGTYTGNLTFKNSYCESTLTIPFSLFCSFQTSGSNAGTDQALTCNTTQTNLAGNDPLLTPPFSGEGTWVQAGGPNTAVIVNPADRNTQINSLVPGTYHFKWSITSGDNCSGAADDVLVRVSNSVPLPVTAGTNQTICFGTPVQIAADLIPSGNIYSMINSSGSIGTWTQISGPAGVVFTNANDPVTTATGLLANAVYVFRFTVSNLCGTTQADVTITTTNTQGPSMADGGPGSCLIASTTSFDLNAVPPAFGTGTWSKLNPASLGTIVSPNSPSTQVIGITTPGLYAYIWTVSAGGCSNSTDTVWASNDGGLITTYTYAGPDQYICNAVGGNVTIQLGAIPPPNGTGLWSQINGVPAIFDPFNPLTMVTMPQPGRYVFRWTVSHRTCGLVYDDIVIYYQTPPPSAAIITPDIVLCSGANGQINLQADPPVGGVWTSFGNSTAVITDPTNAITTATVGPGTTTFRWTIEPDHFACPASYDEMTVAYYPQNASAKSDISLCKTTSTLLQGSSTFSGTGAWSVISQPPGSPVLNFYQQGNDSTYAVNPLVPGAYTFRWTVDAGSCGISFDEMVLTIDDIETPDAGPDLCGISGSPVNLSGSAPLPGTISTWSLLSIPPGAVAGVITNPLANITSYNVPDAGGAYNFQYEYTHGSCSLKDFVSIRVMTPAVANASALAICETPAGLDLSGSDPFPGTGSWDIITQPAGTPPLTWTNQFTQNANVKDFGLGAYTFRYTNTDLICGISADDVTVNSTCFVLPVTLTSFTASVQNCNTILKWASAEESNFKQYQVEQSRDGINFNVINSIPAKGSYSTYSYTPAQASGTMYYRLKLVDMDNSYSYSSIVTAINNCAVLHTRVYPVPADKTATVETEGITTTVKARLFSADGKLVNILTLHNGRNNINIEGLSNGLYQLVIEGAGGNREKHSLVVQH